VNPLKRPPTVISIQRTPTFLLDPSLSSEEAIVLRALAAGQTDRQVCNVLHMDPTTFLRMMRDMREKIGKTDNVSLIEWAKEHIEGVDERIDKPGKYARLA
jgi:DNA-binding NarL/FixJ family response regulator